MEHWAKAILEDALWAGGSLPEDVREGCHRIVDLLTSADTHTFRTEALETLAGEIGECTDLMTLSQAMWQAAQETGFDNFAIFVIRQGRHGAFKTRICTSYSTAWLEHYQARSYQFVDPVITEAARQDGWFLFSSLEAKAPLVREFWADAERFGAGRNGVCFARTCWDGARIGVSFAAAAEAEEVRRNVRLNGYDLACIADLATDCFRATQGPEVDEDTLTLDELRFLKMLATSPDPKAALERSPKYGSSQALQAAIRMKLRVETVFQAVSMASSAGWFDRLPYDDSDVLITLQDLKGWEVLEDEGAEMEEDPPERAKG